MIRRTGRARRLTAAILLPLFVLALTPPPMARAQAPSAPQGGWLTWPKQFPGASYAITVYQPQVEKWDGVRLEARAAVSVEHPASPQQDFGVIWFTARTQVDKENRTVALTNLQVPKASFPGAPAQVDTYLQLLRNHVPANVATISLDRLQANLAVTEAQGVQQKPQPVKNEPPSILFSSVPSYLVLVQGQPVLRQVAGTPFVRVINTYALLLLDQAHGTYYLRFMKRWMAAKTLEGPWTVAANPPAALASVLQSLAKNAQVNPLDAPTPELTEAVNRGIIPTLYVSTVPAELLQTQGPPAYEPIDGTNLLEANNTSDNILIDLMTSDTYVLLSGRWFRTRSLEQGPWTYVPNNELPAGFAKIPPHHPRGVVLAAVSGTPQAQEALIDNGIPQTATVNRATTTLKVSYDGQPQLEAIEGTPLESVVNSPIPVIRVDASSWYAMKDGVWFVATAATGPWSVAGSVPAVIYVIPTSSPLHYVTYVYVYGATSETVVVGYTPGFYGTVVAPAGVVVYGTGYVYPPLYVGAVWYPPPVTYGFGAGFAWGAATGFAFGFAAGAVWGGAWGHCCYGGWHSGSFNTVNINRYNNVNINHNNVYNSWNKNQVNPSGRNPGDTRANRQSPPGQADRGQSRGQPSSNKGLQPQSRPQLSANDTFAGRDGNTYKRGADGGWQQNRGSGWNKADFGGGESADRLNQEQHARSLGSSRDSWGGFGDRGGWGGGDRFGGGRFGGGGFRGGFRR
jgi:uncharacterized membrane protein YgcG